MIPHFALSILLAVTPVARSADGRLVATFDIEEHRWMGSRKCTLIVKDTRTGESICTIRRGIDSATNRLIEKVGGLVMVSQGYGPEYPCSPRLHWGMDAAAFSPDGKQLATCIDGRVRLWEIPSGARSASLVLEDGLPGGVSLVFSKDGRRLIVEDHQTKQLYKIDTRTGERL